MLSASVSYFKVLTVTVALAVPVAVFGITRSARWQAGHVYASDVLVCFCCIFLSASLNLVAYFFYCKVVRSVATLRSKDGVCASCGYAKPESVCPECGTHDHTEPSRTIAKVRLPVLLVSTMTITLGVGTMVVLVAAQDEREFQREVNQRLAAGIVTRYSRERVFPLFGKSMVYIPDHGFDGVD